MNEQRKERVGPFIERNREALGTRYLSYVHDHYGKGALTDIVGFELWAEGELLDMRVRRANGYVI